MTKTAVKMFLKRIQGDRLVIIWRATSYKECVYLFSIFGKMDAEYYTNVLKHVILPAADLLFEDEWTTQKEDMSVHTAQNELVKAYDINILGWLVRSYNLNIIENVGRLLARKVYEGRRQFDDVSTLQYSIMNAWQGINVDASKLSIVLYQTTFCSLAKTSNVHNLLRFKIKLTLYGLGCLACATIFLRKISLYLVSGVLLYSDRYMSMHLMNYSENVHQFYVIRYKHRVGGNIMYATRF